MTMLEHTQGESILPVCMNYIHTIGIPDPSDDRLVAFFDIDNTLYSANHNIAEAMGVRIHGKWVTIAGLHLK